MWKRRLISNTKFTADWSPSWTHHPQIYKLDHNSQKIICGALPSSQIINQLSILLQDGRVAYYDVEYNGVNAEGTFDLGGLEGTFSKTVSTLVNIIIKCYLDGLNKIAVSPLLMH